MKRTLKCISIAASALLLTGCFPLSGVHFRVSRRDDGKYEVTLEPSQGGSSSQAEEMPESSETEEPLKYQIVGDEAELLDFVPDPTFEFGVLPDEIDGVKVTAVGEYGFSRSKCADALHFPNSIVRAGDYAFKGSNVTGWNLFADEVTLGEYCYMDCTQLDDVTFMNKAVTIGDYCFDNSGASIVCSNGCAVTMGDYCFTDMADLEYVTFRGDLRIGEYCFDNCPQMSNVTLGDGRVEIGNYSFRRCAMENLTVSECSGGEFGKCCFNDCHRLSTVLIQEGITAIGANSFNGCTKLSWVCLPASITSIGEHCFAECDGLRITAPEGSYAAEYAEEHGFS